MTERWKSVSTLVFLAFVLGLSFAHAEKIRYKENVKPIFDARCMACHGPDTPEYPEFKAQKERYVREQKGPRMDSYAHLIFFVGWPDTRALMRRLDDGNKTRDGKPGNMYVYLGQTDEERHRNLSIFKQWVGNWILTRWSEISKGELEAMKLAY